MKSLIFDDDGQVFVVVAFFLTAVVGLTALVVDFGSLYLTKSKLQNVVDAAVLAGAQELPGNIEQAKTEINKLIQAYEEDPNNFRIVTNNNDTTIEVNGSKTGQLYFAHLLGIKAPIIEARSKVVLRPIASASGIIPLGFVQTDNLAFGSPFTLKEKVNGDGFTSLILSGSGAKQFELDLTYGYDGEIQIGDLLNTRKGTMAQPTIRGIQARMNSCPNATYRNYPANCERVVLVPMYTLFNSSQVKVVGFATIFLEGVSTSNEGAEIYGRFIQHTISGNVEMNEELSLETDYGTYGYKLSR